VPDGHLLSALMQNVSKEIKAVKKPAKTCGFRLKSLNSPPDGRLKQQVFFNASTLRFLNAFSSRPKRMLLVERNCAVCSYKQFTIALLPPLRHPLKQASSASNP